MISKKNIVNLYSIIDDRLKFQSILLTFLMFFAALFEMLGVGMVIPLLSFVVDNTIVEKFNDIYFIEMYFLSLSYNFQLIILSCIIILLFLIKNLYLAFISWLQSNFQKKFILYTSEKILKIHLKKSVKLFNQNNSNQYSKDINTDVVYLTTTLNAFAIVLFETFIILLISVLLIFYIPWMTLLILLLFGFFALMYLKIYKQKILMWGKNRSINEEKKFSLLKDIFSSILEIKIYNAHKIFIKKFNDINNKYSSSLLSHHFYQSLPKLIIEILAIISIITLLIFLAFTSQNSEIIPILGLFTASTFKIIPSITRIISSKQQIRFINPIIEKLKNEINDSKAQNTLNKDRLSDNINFSRNINIENLFFGYDTKVNIIKNFSLDIKYGEKIVIAGKSGVGKSTLIKLILGLIEPKTGVIKVDGINIKQNLDSWHQNIAYVPQNAFLLDDTILNNILFGIKSYSENDLKKCIEICELEPLINSLNQGINFTAGENGNLLSGGQKQKIIIARALIRKKPLLILDESLNAIDRESRSKILENIKKIKDKTVILITHDNEFNFSDKIVNII
ncbi:ATP-binding cassette domain-containing protein [Candidatus Pelagibacter sp. HIMB1517]|uniref:ATP-binding cassette domain-containing protein n=1 Tax=Candidatus Pelagibacter sp. HIMB1517 TaxID=3413341 RepID=UPI003F85A219